MIKFLRSTLEEFVFMNTKVLKFVNSPKLKNAYGSKSVNILVGQYFSFLLC